MLQQHIRAATTQSAEAFHHPSSSPYHLISIYETTYMNYASGRKKQGRVSGCCPLTIPLLCVSGIIGRTSAGCCHACSNAMFSPSEIVYDRRFMVSSTSFGVTNILCREGEIISSRNSFFSDSSSVSSR